jgi:hypothetical protein
MSFEDTDIAGRRFTNHEDDAMLRHRLQRAENLRLAALRFALAQGFDIFTPCHGLDKRVDFILYHEPDNCLIKIKMLGRWTIEKKYVGRGIWMLFRIDRDWFLVPHDTLMEWNPRALLSPSWTEKGHYHITSPSVEMRAKCDDFHFGIEEPPQGETPNGHRSQLYRDQR